MKRALGAMLVVAAWLPSSAAAVPAPGAELTRSDYFNLIRRYANGERLETVSRLGAWSERDLARQLAGIEQAARAAERCPACPSILEGLPLKAAVMLHWDRDRAEQPPAEGVEQLRRCPGPQARLAARYARLLAARPETKDFARRFFVAVVTQCQWDACFEAAEEWTRDAIEIFPRDAELLLVRGGAREEDVTLRGPARTSQPPDLSPASAATYAETARGAAFQKAREDFEEALRIDPTLGVARLRLGRVYWRLGELEASRGALEELLASVSRPEQLYLAHLFLGRVHEDSGRLTDATVHYRLAVDLYPSAQAAAVALSHALWQSGESDTARLALRQGLAYAGRRLARDPYWDYLVGNGVDTQRLFEALHKESLLR